MADDSQDKMNAEGKRLPLKTIIVVLAMLVAEAGGIIVLMNVIGRPSDVKGVGLTDSMQAEEDRLHEIPIMSEKLTNNASGRIWIYDTEIMAQVRGRNAEITQAELERREAEIRTGISRIFSSAQHAHFNEPGRETLTRQVLQYLRDVFGQDSEGEEIVQNALIPKCLGFPAQ